jgi:hypothetical protein
MKAYSNPVASGAATATRLVAHSPPASPRFVRPAPGSAAEAPAPYLVSHISEMLQRGPERAAALIQTLVAHRSTSVLSLALKRDPSLLDAELLLALANCDAGREFVAALQLRPDLVTPELALDLCGGSSKPRFLAAVIEARPELRSALGNALSQSLVGRATAPASGHGDGP